MSFKPTIWTHLGLGVAILGAASLAGCGGEQGEAANSTSVVTQSANNNTHEDSGEAGEHGESGESGEAGHDTGALPRHLRLAFMTGHIEAGLALYRAGEPSMAAKHLLHPVSETHAAERAGLDALGFQADLFKAVSVALEQGRAASEIESLLRAAEANLALLAERSGGDLVEIIKFLMDTINEEYAVGVTNGAVTDPGEYQDAYGFAIVAQNRAAAIEGLAGDRIRTEIETLIALWPGTPPVPTNTPAPLSKIRAQTRRVLLELSAVQ